MDESQEELMPVFALRENNLWDFQLTRGAMQPCSSPRIEKCCWTWFKMHGARTGSLEALQEAPPYYRPVWEEKLTEISRACELDPVRTQ